MPYYLLGLGSNINPRHNLQQAQPKLAALGQVIDQSDIVETPAEGSSFSGSFCNQLVILRCALPPTMVKHRLQRIEVAMGREPKSPSRKTKDRTIDLDILGQANSLEACRQLPLEDSYYRQVQDYWSEKV
ncbi:hypothetical protein GCM10011297_01990 [Bacterioplanes sanyensis]|uniref:2-amino-4-hydroxy-6- hydroxymethyldihydropteridine diphosphokinase n=1 Tax=Bacterioplanes sanyensis TaxID=1249553 RepID=UPI001679494C|nr:2-amino-4-hydroxy-6-hydroxymethyldihydropteridine diphosphokinase [Bacterioplanes sanyensis]GGY32668.1 hypothetical protein GCM10011297_01990 [Bacterioplanes sanyensis]